MNRFQTTVGPLLFLITAGVTGCVAEVEPVRPVVAVDAPVYAEIEPVEGYRPMLYNGAVVYYDGAARPFYYASGVVTYVPRASVGYGVLVNHYHAYRGVYGRWYAHYGAHYRVYHAWHRG